PSPAPLSSRGQGARWSGNAGRVKQTHGRSISGAYLSIPVDRCAVRQNESVWAGNVVPRAAALRLAMLEMHPALGPGRNPAFCCGTDTQACEAPKGPAWPLIQFCVPLSDPTPMGAIHCPSD